MLGPVPIAPNLPIIPRLIGETGPQEFWEGPALQKFIQSCEGVSDPVILSSGAYYYPRGLYQLFETAKGERVGIVARDPADLVLGDFVVTQEWSKKLKLAGQDIPAGTVFGGGYLQDLGNGNLSRLVVFTARENYTADKWFFNETVEHNKASLARAHEQERLLRIKGAWTSNATVYRLEKDNFVYSRIDERYKKLVVTGAVTPGWDLNEQYDRHFTGLNTAFTDAASISVEGVDALQARIIVNYDFTQHLNHSMQGKNAYDLPFDGTAGDRPYVGRLPLRETIRRLALNVTYAYQQQTMKERAMSASGVIAGNAIVFGGMWSVGMPIVPVMGITKIGGQLMSQTSAKVLEFMRRQRAITADDKTAGIMQENTIGWTSAQVWGGRFNENRVPFLRAIPADRIINEHHFARTILSKLPEHHDALANMYEPIEGQVSGFYVGGHPAVRIDSPTGLSVQYFSDMRIAVLRDRHPACAYELRASLKTFFKKISEDRPFVVINHDSQTGLYKYKCISQESYDALMASTAEKPYVNKKQKGHADMPDIEAVTDEKPKGKLVQIAEKIFGDGAAVALHQGIREATINMPFFKPRVL